jgi:hypothetical protein
MNERRVWDLNELLKCCRREVETRQRVYPKWIERGFISEKKAASELEAMRSVVDYFVDAIFYTATRQALPVPKRATSVDERAATPETSPLAQRLASSP